MDKVNKQELRRLAEECEEKGLSFKEEPMMTCLGKLAAKANPAAILSLLDELEENDGVIAVWRGRLQRAEAELEQYRKDAERYRWLRAQEAEQGLAVLHVSGWERAATCWATTYPDAEMLDSAIDAEMAKEGGANG